MAAPVGFFILFDESYNANPSSVRAAMKLLALSTPQKHGRRIAVLGDMLELVEHAAELHAGLAGDIAEAGVDQVFVCGKDMQHLWMKLPQGVRARYAKNCDELSEPLLATIEAGDVVMIKGSLGSRMGPLVDAIHEKFEPATETQTDES